MNEFEVKLQVPPEQAERVAADVRRGDACVLRLQARYFDTADERLAAGRLTLRLRQEGPDWVQTLKAPGASAFDRLEHEVARGPQPPAQPDLALHAGSPAGAALAAAVPDLSPAALRPTFSTDIQRVKRTIASSVAEVEIAFDRGEIRAGDRVLPVCELEFERKRGSLAAVVELAQAWCRAHGLWLDPQSKSAAGRRLARGEAQVPPATATPVTAGEAGPASSSDWLAHVLDEGLQQVLDNAREIAAGLGSDDHVHQLRVGLRRLRTALRELRMLPELHALDPQLEPALAAVFRALGEDRDAAVLLPALAGEIAAAGAPAPVADWRAARPDVEAAIRAPAFQCALLTLVGLAAGLQQSDAPPLLRKPLRKLVARRLRKLHRKARRDGLVFAELEDSERHRVRKQYKRLRYLSELARPLFPGRRIDRFVAQLKEVQELLGRYQDTVAGRRLYRLRACADPAAWFGVGWLAAREEALARECAGACRKLERRVRPFWG